MEHPTTILIIQFNHGDTRGILRLSTINIFHPVTIFVRKFIPSGKDAEDITADIFVKLMKMHAKFDSIQNIEAFLYIPAGMPVSIS